MRVVRVILGLLLLVVGLPALLVGGAFWIVMQHRDAGGAFTGTLERADTDGYAVVVRDADGVLAQGAPFTRAGQSTLRVTARTSTGPAFVGIAPTKQVSDYLATTSYLRVDAVDLGTGDLPLTTTPVGTDHRRPAAPADQPFWLASGFGSVDWTPSQLRDTRYSLVVMNPDARAGLEVTATAEVRPSWLNTTTWALLVLGSILTALGTLTLAWPGRRREVVYVVEPSQVTELADRIGVPLPTGHAARKGRDNRPRTLADAAWPESAAALSAPAPALTWPPALPSSAPPVLNPAAGLDGASGGSLDRVARVGDIGVPVARAGSPSSSSASPDVVPSEAPADRGAAGRADEAAKVAAALAAATAASSADERGAEGDDDQVSGRGAGRDADAAQAAARSVSGRGDAVKSVPARGDAAKSVPARGDAAKSVPAGGDAAKSDRAPVAKGKIPPFTTPALARLVAAHGTEAQRPAARSAAGRPAPTQPASADSGPDRAAAGSQQAPRTADRHPTAERSTGRLTSAGQVASDGEAASADRAGPADKGADQVVAAPSTAPAVAGKVTVSVTDRATSATGDMAAQAATAATGASDAKGAQMKAGKGAGAAGEPVVPAARTAPQQPVAARAGKGSTDEATSAEAGDKPATSVEAGDKPATSVEAGDKPATSVEAGDKPATSVEAGTKPARAGATAATAGATVTATATATATATKPAAVGAATAGAALQAAAELLSGGPPARRRRKTAGGLPATDADLEPIIKPTRPPRRGPQSRPPAKG